MPLEGVITQLNWWRPDWEPENGILDKARRLQLELWRRRLAEAQVHHQEALGELTRTIEANGLGEAAPHPDAWKGVLEARVAESDALSVYIEALRVYSALAERAASAARA